MLLLETMLETKLDFIDEDNFNVYYDNKLYLEVREFTDWDYNKAFKIRQVGGVQLEQFSKRIKLENANDSIVIGSKNKNVITALHEFLVEYREQLRKNKKV